MKALTWQATRRRESGMSLIRGSRNPTTRLSMSRRRPSAGRTCTCTGCGPYLKPGDILGHETMGVVAEVGPGITSLKAGDRAVVPFNISCGYCWRCSRGLFAQCATTQVRAEGKGAALFGCTSLYGSVPGGPVRAG